MDNEIEKTINVKTEESAERVVDIPEIINILPLRDTVAFPILIVPVAVGREASVKLVDDSVSSGNRTIGVITMKDPSVENPTVDDIYGIGTVVVIRMMGKMPDGIRMVAQGLVRFEITEVLQTSPYIRARIRTVDEERLPSDATQPEVEALKRTMLSLYERIIALSQNNGPELEATANNSLDASLLTDMVASQLNISIADKQTILETFDVKERMRLLMKMMSRELEVLEIGSRLQNEVHTEMSRSQREYFLREQLKAIQRELGDDVDRTQELDELRKKLEEANPPEEAMAEAQRELERLGRIPPQSPEYTVAHTYLDWMIDLPWNKSTTDNLDITAVRKVLDADHYGLDKVKERIVEYLAVRKFRGDDALRQPILCLAGPPGVGKTSLGKSIARAIGRNFVRMSLGGVRDEAEIRGHRRTYIGSMPGQIIQGIRRAGSNNPLFMLDEIDKVGADFRGDPSSALLEALDPEQNSTFRDHYLDVPVNLGKVLFITTANVLDSILPPLRDRMEIIELMGYTIQEKIYIGKNHLIPKQMKEHGLTGKHIRWSDTAIRAIIEGYTREAGVRNLEREIASVCRKVTRLFAEGREKMMSLNPKQVEELLGVPRFETEEISKRTETPGVAIGLAWTPVGGDVLYIEAAKMAGKKGMIITGQLGDVMKESTQIALSWIRAHADKFGLTPDVFENNELHVHVPAGAIPKDGPSAGVTMTTALVSLLTGVCVKPRLAMTGELTLSGKVLPIGGVKEKVLAAHRAGVDHVILPSRNRKDLIEDVPDEVRDALLISYVDTIDEVLKIALPGLSLA